MQNRNKTLNSFKMEHTENGTLVSFMIPQKQLDESQFLNEQQIKARACDIIGAFSPLLIASLERRMEACKEKLMKNLASAYTNEYGMQIFYKDGERTRAFNMPSFTAMEDCVKALKFSCFGEVIENRVWIDQIIKALMNDPANYQVHDDMGGFAYSQLVSLLTEIHFFEHE